MMTDTVDELVSQISLVAQGAREFNEEFYENRETIHALQRKIEEVIEGERLGTIAGALVQLLMEYCRMAAEAEMKEVPGQMPYEEKRDLLGGALALVFMNTLKNGVSIDIATGEELGDNVTGGDDDQGA